MPLISAEYAAGFFDGEGCVNLTVAGKHRAVVLRVMLTNTDRDLLDQFREQFGGCICRIGHRRSQWKPAWYLSMTGRNGIAFLRFISAASRIKRQQVDLALAFWAFHDRPKSERCDFFPGASLKIGGRGTVSRIKPGIREREQQFKADLHVLNRRGA